MEIDAKGMYYKELNEKIRKAVESGINEITLRNINGQKYIGAGLQDNDLNLKINGVPGNDLAAFMDGPSIDVGTNVQDAVGNTMNSGKITIEGNAGDVLGHSMRGGNIYVKGDAGYRVGIHMKAYKTFFPVMIIGGSVEDYIGEYMAGGLIIVLGIGKKGNGVAGNYIGTGMHGGEVYIRGPVKNHQLGKGVKICNLKDRDLNILKKYLKKYSQIFSIDLNLNMVQEFTKLIPKSHRPYEKIYTY